MATMEMRQLLFGQRLNALTHHGFVSSTHPYGIVARSFP